MLQDIKEMTTGAMIVDQLLEALKWSHGPLSTQRRKFNPKSVVPRAEQELSEYEIFLRECGSRPQLASQQEQLR